MVTDLQTILVTGATGRQGGAVVDALLSEAFAGEFDALTVRGLTRDAESDAARRLAERGVEVVEGDMLDRDSLFAAMEGADAVFGVTTFFEVGAEAEREQGLNLVAAAEAADVGHVVFSSVGDADGPDLPHFQSKAAVEDALWASSLDATVLRPVFFMQNLAMNAEDVADGHLALGLAEDTRLAMVDYRDIGRAAATVFADPDSFAGETIDLAGDRRTLAETAAVLSEYTGHPVEPVSLDVETVRDAAGDEFADMFAWFNETGYSADVAAAERRLGFETTSLVDCLAETAFLPRASTTA